MIIAIIALIFSVVSLIVNVLILVLPRNISDDGWAKSHKGYSSNPNARRMEE